MRLKMRNTSSTKVNLAKHLFCFITFMGFVMVGYYKHSLFNQTRRIDNLLTFLEEQKSKIRVVQLAKGSNSSGAFEHGQTILHREHTASNKSRPWDVIVPSHRIETCTVNLSSCEHTWAASWQNQQNEFATSEDSDQPGHPPSLIRVFAVRMKKASLSL